MRRCQGEVLLQVGKRNGHRTGEPSAGESNRGGVPGGQTRRGRVGFSMPIPSKEILKFSKCKSLVLTWHSLIHNQTQKAMRRDNLAQSELMAMLCRCIEKLRNLVRYLFNCVCRCATSDLVGQRRAEVDNLLLCDVVPYGKKDLIT